MIKKALDTRRDIAEMGILEHLAELRGCLVHSISSIVVASFVAFYYSSLMFDFLTNPFKQAFGETALIGTGPGEALSLKIMVSLFGGTIIALPYVFYQIWKFIYPALHDHEKKWAFPFIIVTTIFFLAGVYFSYQVVLPITFSFFLDEYKSINLVPQIRLSEHLTFTLKALIGFGLIFELPILSFILARFGLITAKAMISAFRYVIVGIFIIAAVLTPPDAVSQLLMAGPMLILYAISIVIVRISEVRSNENS